MGLMAFSGSHDEFVTAKGAAVVASGFPAPTARDCHSGGTTPFELICRPLDTVYASSISDRRRSWVAKETSVSKPANFASCASAG